jgi:hypothetical protein
MIKFDDSKVGKDSSENWIISTVKMVSNFKDTNSPYNNIPSELEE